MAQTFTYIEKKRGFNKVIVNHGEYNIEHDVVDIPHALGWVVEYIKDKGGGELLDYGLKKFKERHGITD